MYIVNEDNSIYITRGDILAMSVTAKDKKSGKAYKFKAGDIVRINIHGRKECDNVVLQKDFPVAVECDAVDIFLEENDTKIGESISKPKDYWYEIVLNPDTNPQTIIGYDDDNGPIVFKLFPEGGDIEEDEPITPEDIPIVDGALDISSERPVENKAIAREIIRLEGAIQSAKAEAEAMNSDVSAKAKSLEEELSVERARITNLATLEEGSTTGDAELQDMRVDAHGVKWSNAGNSVRSISKYFDSRLNGITTFKKEKVEIETVNGYYDKTGAFAEHTNHKCARIAVAESEIYFANTYYGYAVPDAVALGENDEFICCYHTNASAMEYSDFGTPLVIPTGCKTLVINACSDYVCEVQKAVNGDFKYDTFEKYADNIVKSVVGGNENRFSQNLCTEYATKTLINKSANVVAFDNETYVTAEIDVSAGERLSITYGYHYLNYGYVFLDDKNIVVRTSKLGDGTEAIRTVTEDIIVPFNAVKLILAHITTSGYPCAYKIEGCKENIWANKKWVCVGDSLTEVNNRTTKHYHDYIAEKTGIEVVNMGVSGSGYMMLQESNKAFYQRVSAVPIDADVVTIFGSGNDLSKPLGETTDKGTNTVCGCINTTIDELLSVMPTTQIGIVTPTPWESCPPSVVGNKMELYSNAILEICKRRSIPCLDLYHCSNLRPWDNAFKELAYSKDNGNGVHPDETGHRIIAPRFKAFLESLLI